MYRSVGPCTRSCANKHKGMPIGGGGGGGGGGGKGGGEGEGREGGDGGEGRGGDIFCGGGTKSVSRMCPPGQNPLADSVRGDIESASGFYPGGHNPLADSVRGDDNWGGQNPL